MSEPLPIADYDYVLPPELIAQTPAEPRDSARLLVIPRAGGPVRHDAFHNLGHYLRPGDLLVLNRTLAGLPVARRKGADAISVPLRLTRLADERRDFMAALMGAISLK